MRRLIAVLLVVILSVATFESCGRYENGPEISLRSAKSRIVGEWHLADLLVNDKREQTLFDMESSSELTFNDDGTYLYNKVQSVKFPQELVGEWSFGEDKTELLLIQRDSINGDSERMYKITRLSKDELWLVNGSEEYSGYDDLIERHFEKKQE
ncbi:MAG: DUF5004 domain-containing protein [Bacteroidales bacterium]|jgi:hypothetical protein|nr:DUF5004 domain-containing protein [Bacteroidales bacterium]MBQ1654864.1 DUF5004 domain-containing protein [Bacteroidales bacterium]MBQ1694990.1 DUF5004 domain-containing protein [Bacteroidales bacterium]MBQ1719955.1 DUF5004 domain-containing protein [Bacteroidales bacterium]MBQ1731579.1 DUF5004 domain-containing protein [Bacteroidales bacterium]